ncbi:MAG: hypothetical protein ACYCYI_09165 [Saccharofermentanales bacterium]
MKQKVTTITGKKFYTVPNQRIIMINKNLPTKGEEYAIFQKENLFKTKRELSDKAFTLWLYLSSQADTKGIYGWALSRVHYMEVTGECKSSYARAVDELIIMGYLIQENPTTIKFFEAAQKVDNPGRMVSTKNLGIPKLLIDDVMLDYNIEYPQPEAKEDEACTLTEDSSMNDEECIHTEYTACIPIEYTACIHTEYRNSIIEIL